jgi:Raf kinase inhibitor-like YbhB/YbcL family protein
MKVHHAFVLVAWGCHDSAVTPGPANGVTPEPITVSSPAFAAGASIPVDFTCDGIDQNPHITWTAVPTKARSLAIVVDDPDAPSGTFTHWLVWNIKPETRMLGSSGLGGGMSGTNDFGKPGYSGPCPPKGKPHHYRFSVYGLDTMLTLRSSDKRNDLDRAMNNHIVAQGTLSATYEH